MEKIFEILFLFFFPSPPKRSNIFFVEFVARASLMKIELAPTIRKPIRELANRLLSFHGGTPLWNLSRSKHSLNSSITCARAKSPITYQPTQIFKQFEPEISDARLSRDKKFPFSVPFSLPRPLSYRISLLVTFI